jgi:hypothetical protein
LFKNRSYENKVGLLGFVDESREFFAGVVTSASHDLALAWHPVLSSSSPLLLSSLFRRTYTPKKSTRPGLQPRDVIAGSFGNSEVPSIGFSRGSPTEQPPYVGFTINISRAESKFTFWVEKGEQGENNQQRNAKSEKTKSGKGKQADTDDKPANANSKVECKFGKGDLQLSYRVLSDDEKLHLSRALANVPNGAALAVAGGG